MVAVSQPLNLQPEGLFKPQQVLYRKQISAATTGSSTIDVYQVPQGYVFVMSSSFLIMSGGTALDYAQLHYTDASNNIFSTFAVSYDVAAQQGGVSGNTYIDGFYIYGGEKIRLQTGTGFSANCFIVGNLYPVGQV